MNLIDSVKQIMHTYSFAIKCYYTLIYLIIITPIGKYYNLIHNTLFIYQCIAIKYKTLSLINQHKCNEFG